VEDVDARDGSTYITTVVNIDSRRDDFIVTFTLPTDAPEDQYGNPTPCRNKWQYADMVRVVDANLFPTWDESK
jgi:hypothetical protein